MWSPWAGHVKSEAPRCFCWANKAPCDFCLKAGAQGISYVKIRPHDLPALKRELQCRVILFRAQSPTTLWESFRWIRGRVTFELKFHLKNVNEQKLHCFIAGEDSLQVFVCFKGLGSNDYSNQSGRPFVPETSLASTPLRSVVPSAAPRRKGRRINRLSMVNASWL